MVAFTQKTTHCVVPTFKNLCGMTLAEPLVLYGVPNIPGLVVPGVGAFSVTPFEQEVA